MITIADTMRVASFLRTRGSTHTPTAARRSRSAGWRSRTPPIKNEVKELVATSALEMGRRERFLDSWEWMHGMTRRKMSERYRSP